MERRFGNWTMGLVNAKAVNRSVLLNYSTTATLAPFAITGQATMARLMISSPPAPSQGGRPS